MMGANPFGDLKITVIELNTEYTRPRGFMDETERVLCLKCRRVFRLGDGMTRSLANEAIWNAHRDLCEGDAAVTLMKIEQAYKEAHRERDNPKEGTRL